MDDVDQDYDRMVLQKRELNARLLEELDLKGSVAAFTQEFLKSRPPKEVKPRQRTEKPSTEIRRSERSVGREAPVYVDSLPRRLVTESGTTKSKRRAYDCSDGSDDEGQPRRKRVRNTVVSERGWNADLGVANQRAQQQAEDAAKACSARLAAEGRVVSAPKRLTESQVAGGFWHNLPAAWYRRFAHEPKGYKWLHCNEKWPAGHRATESNSNNNDVSNDNDNANGVSSSGGNGTSSHPQSNSDDDAAPAQNGSESTPGSSMWRWPVIFLPRGPNGGGLSGGWRGFAIDHALYPGDSMFYEQITEPKSYGTDHWLVHVFRAYDYDTSVRPESAGSVPDEDPGWGCFDDDHQAELFGKLKAEDEVRENRGRTQTVSRAPKASPQCQQPQQHHHNQQQPQQRQKHVQQHHQQRQPQPDQGTSTGLADGCEGHKNSSNGCNGREVNKNSRSSNSSRGQAGQGSKMDKQGSGAKGQDGKVQDDIVRDGAVQEGNRKRGRQQQQQQKQKQVQQQHQQQQKPASVKAQQEHAMEEEEEEEEEEFYLKRIKGYMFVPPVGQSKPVDWFHIRWWGEYDCPQYDSWEPVSCLDQEPWKYAWAKGALPKKWQAQRTAWLQSLSTAGRAQFERDEAEEQALEEEEARTLKKK